VQPPFMGQGLCSGIRDTANLAWKLALVCQGAASEGLLDSYQVERSPHARAWIDEANRIGDIVTMTDPAEAAERDKRILGGSRELAPITPRLGPGLHGGLPAPAGTLSTQPVLAAGRRLDDTVGLRFAIVAPQQLIDELPADAGPSVVSSDWMRVVSEPEVVDHYRNAYGCEATVIRPDRYVLGTADDGATLQRLLQRLPMQPAAIAS
jgi:3-(3-hydroxy-phenyl)propionate hydroxylase